MIYSQVAELVDAERNIGNTLFTGSNPVLTTMNRAVELITQRNADSGDERPIYSFLY
jgi:hypothetical protein